MKRMLGVDFKRFYSDPAIWGPDTYWDDGTISVDGNPEASLDGEAVSDTSIVVIDGGELYEHLPGVPVDLEACIDWWRARQENAAFSVQVPKDKVEAFKAAMAGFGLEPVEMG